MFRKQHVRLVACTVAGPLLVGACGPGLTAPREPQSLAPPPAAVATNVGLTAGAAVVIEDALSRLLPSLSAPTAASLKGPLIAVQAAVLTGNGSALQGAIAVARNALVRRAASGDAPDLAAISLALDAAASGQ